MSDGFLIDAELQAQIDQARQAGESLSESEPFAVEAWYEAANQLVFIEMNDGVLMGFPSELLQGLEDVTDEHLSQFELISTGYGLHGESLDVDLGFPQIISGFFGSKKWMQELGRRGETVKSTVKAKASRENGKLGGRPKKSDRVAKQFLLVNGNDS